jgi:imidazolonepropionase
MTIDLLIHSAHQLLTVAGGPQRGSSLGQLGLIEDGAVAIHQGEVVETGISGELLDRFAAEHIIDASGQLVMPGFVDPHTHLVWAGDRAEEYELRQQGATYMEILAKGGGILSTVRRSRAASVEDLVRQSLDRAQRMLAHGTTTAEAKSGYGLEWESEKRLMQAILQVDAASALELVPTFLGAHAVPPEYQGRADEYASVVAGQMLPDLRSWWAQDHSNRPLPFVDAFCEEGAFSVEQTRRILTSARDLGFPLKVHVDEFKALGGTTLAVELGAVSADHLVRTTGEEIQALARSETVAVALPCTPFGLNEQAYTPAAKILSAGGLLALASDLNPGTGWCESMQFVLALACRKMDLTPAQAIAAATINAAAAIGRQDRLGSLEPGKQADVIILDVPDYRHLGYRFGANLVSTVVKHGRVIGN